MGFAATLLIVATQYLTSREVKPFPASITPKPDTSQHILALTLNHPYLFLEGPLPLRNTNLSWVSYKPPLACSSPLKMEAGG